MSQVGSSAMLDEENKQRQLRDFDAQRDGDQKRRRDLQDFVAQLRDAGEPYAMAPANPATPSFKLGDAKGFTHVSDGPAAPDRGHLSESAYKDFLGEMKKAAQSPDAHSRDAATGRAAQIVAQDYGKKHGLAEVKAEVLHAARAQATFAAREIGAKIGLDPATSSVVGYSLERALENQGFRVMVNRAIDGVGNFTASAAATSGAIGMRHSMETKLSQSMTWLAEHGVTREALKDSLNKHMGKFTAVAEAARHPEVFQRAAQLIAHSGGALDAVKSLATDQQLRQAVGTLSLATGEAIGTVHKGAASVAVLTGAALKGEAAEDMGRHVFRAAMSIAGGAGGAIAMGAGSMGFGALAGGVLGSKAGEAAADYLLDKWDEFTGRQKNTPTHSVSQQEVADSRQIIADRARGGIAQEVAAHREQGREHTMSMGMGKA